MINHSEVGKHDIECHIFFGHSNWIITKNAELFTKKFKGLTASNSPSLFLHETFHIKEKLSEQFKRGL